MTAPQPFDLTGPLPVGTTVLEASAGTGKTYAIAALAARYVAEGVARLDQLMLVTFSRAATQELRARVRERFESTRIGLLTSPAENDSVTQLLAAVPEPERRLRAERLGAALAEFDAATIATTHEFCHRMAAGLGTLAPQTGERRFVENLDDEIRAATLDLYVARFADVEPRQRPFAVDEAVRWVRTIFRQPGISVGPDGGVGVQGARVDFCREVRRLVDQRRKARGIATYDDELTGLLAALSHPLTGEQAVERVAARYPVVLIDEFQDTDPIQWEIVQRAFLGRSTLVLIGDPKQAIYGFRGADVYSYLDAVRHQAQVHTLATNYRSDGAVVTAVNALLGGAGLGEPEIVVRPVASKHGRRIAGPEQLIAPVRIRTLTSDDDERLSADSARALVAADLVADITTLLTSGVTLTIDGRPRPVVPSDIAVLVVKNDYGETLHRLLREARVPAVFTAAGSVYDTPAASDWLTLLRALATQRAGDVRAAAMTSFVGWPLSALLAEDQAPLAAHAARIRRWARTLSEVGMAALLDQLWEETDLEARLLAHDGGERTVTDLRHLGQNLVLAQNSGSTSAHALVSWLERQRERSSGDEDALSRRLDSDADAVQIMTVHRSKGLEFPIVYLPQAGLRYQGSDEGQPIVVHGGDPARLLDVGGVPTERTARLERAERFARHRREDGGDDLRKFYVGLTRAQCQVVTWWPVTKANLGASALQRALFRDPGAADVVPEPSYADVDLQALRARLEPLGVRFEAGPSTVQRLPRPQERQVELRAAELTRSIDEAWRRTSYSALTAGLHGAVAAPDGREPDEPDDDTAMEMPVAGAAPGSATADGPGAALSPMADLPGGTQFGSLVHAIFEYLDPTKAALPAALDESAQRWLARYPVRGVEPTALVSALEPALRTPLGPLADDRTLADLAPRDRLAELEFELPLGDTTVAALADVIEATLPSDDVLAAYPAMLRAEGLGAQRLRGFLTGSIDALIRVGDPGQQRYVVVDYKTNRVGPPGTPLLVGHYARPALAEAMMASHYPLQALLYAVATHRFLRWRLPDYDPARHLGGVLYLFVRGMAGPEARDDHGSYGVFDWHPPAQLVVALSDRIGGAA